MAQTSVAQFASELKVPPSVLLEQLRAAGVDKKQADDALSEAEFNAWYDKEHLPGLAAVPGVVRAVRLRRLDGRPAITFSIFRSQTASEVSVAFWMAGFPQSALARVFGPRDGSSALMMAMGLSRACEACMSRTMAMPASWPLAILRVSLGRAARSVSIAVSAATGSTSSMVSS